MPRACSRGSASCTTALERARHLERVGAVLAGQRQQHATPALDHGVAERNGRAFAHVGHVAHQDHRIAARRDHGALQRRDSALPVTVVVIGMRCAGEIHLPGAAHARARPARRLTTSDQREIVRGEPRRIDLQSDTAAARRRTP